MSMLSLVGETAVILFVMGWRAMSFHKPRRDNLNDDAEEGEDARQGVSLLSNLSD